MKPFEELDRLTIPHFDYPWPSACSADVEHVERETKAWAMRYELIPNGRYLTRVTRTKYGWLAARCYPHADRELLQILADYFIWFFLVDDLFVDRVETITARVIPNLTAMIDVLDFDAAQPHPTFGELAWLDVCQRLRRRLSAEHFQRFAHGMRMWATTAGLQILNHTQEASVKMRQYETIRRHTSGMNPCLALVDAANAAPLTPEEFHHPDMQQMSQHTNNVVCWSNDVQSLSIELRQPGQYWNMVPIRAAEGCSLQQGVEYTADRVRAEVASFQCIAERVEPGANRRVRGAIAGMRHWMRGYQDWVVHDTQRYLVEHVVEDANDTGLLIHSSALPPSGPEAGA